MALTFETGTALGQKDFLDKLVTFMGGVTGWTVQDAPNPSVPVNEPGGATYANDVSATFRLGTGCYFTICTQVDNARPRMFMAAHTVWSGGLAGGTRAWFAHAGGYGGAAAGNPWYEGISVPATQDDTGSGLAVAFNYVLAADETYLWAFIEVGAGSGYWQSFCFCQLTLFDDADGGYYCCGTVNHDDRSSALADYNNFTLASNMMRNVSPIGLFGQPTKAGSLLMPDLTTWRRTRSNDSDSGTDPDACYSNLSNKTGTTNTIEGVASFKTDDKLQTNPSNITSPLVPTVFYIPSTVHSDHWYPFGYLPGAYYCPSDVIGDSQVIASGADLYAVFAALKTRRTAHKHQYGGIAVKIVL